MESTYNNFKITTINILKELKENIKLVRRQVKNSFKKAKGISRNEKSVSKMTILQDECNKRLDSTEEAIMKLKI